MKSFTITNTEKKINWANANLDKKDFTMWNGCIVIKYNAKFQKNDILNAIN